MRWPSTPSLPRRRSIAFSGTDGGDRRVRSDRLPPIEGSEALGRPPGCRFVTLFTGASRTAPMSKSDKYPAESGRRRFVKGVVGGAALAGVGAMGSATVNSLTTSGGVGGGSTVATTIAKTGGPAPRGLPQIPLRVTDDGFIEGIWPETTTVTQEGQEIQVAQQDLGGKTYSGEWFQYCGVESQDNIALRRRVPGQHRPRLRVRQPVPRRPGEVRLAGRDVRGGRQDPRRGLRRLRRVGQRHR